MRWVFFIFLVLLCGCLSTSPNVKTSSTTVSPIVFHPSTTVSTVGPGSTTSSIASTSTISSSSSTTTTIERMSFCDSTGKKKSSTCFQPEYSRDKMNCLGDANTWITRCYRWARNGLGSCDENECTPDYDRNDSRDRDFFCRDTYDDMSHHCQLIASNSDQTIRSNCDTGATNWFTSCERWAVTRKGICTVDLCSPESEI